MAEGRGIGPLRPKTFAVYRTAPSTSQGTLRKHGMPTSALESVAPRKLADSKAIANYFLTATVGSCCAAASLIQYTIPP
jgi:hypothetical protein